MKNECSIVRDLLPLYAEHMLSDDTTMFVYDHLQQCPYCQNAYEELKKELPLVNDEETSRRAAEKNALIAARKKMRRRDRIEIVVILSCIVAAILLVMTFPVHRLIHIAYTFDDGFYDTKEIAMLAYAGDPFDRIEIQPFMHLTEEAFADITHTAAENKAKYGEVLGDYAYATDTPAHLYDGMPSRVEFSIKLWSAHLDGDHGYLWVFYSQSYKDPNGESISGSWKIPSLWEVAKDDTGNWMLVGTKQTP